MPGRLPLGLDLLNLDAGKERGCSSETTRVPYWTNARGRDRGQGAGKLDRQVDNASLV